MQIGNDNAAPYIDRKVIDSWDWADIAYSGIGYRRHVKRNGRRVARRRAREEIRQGLFD